MAKRGGVAVRGEVRRGCTADGGTGLLAAWLSVVELGGVAPLRVERGGWWRG